MKGIIFYGMKISSVSESRFWIISFVKPGTSILVLTAAFLTNLIIVENCDNHQIGYL